MRENLFAKAAAKKMYDVFKDERYLYPEYIPERLPHRDSEIDALVYAFNPVLKGKKPVNVALVGSTGVGKTVVTKYVVKELEEHSERARSVYINCFEYNSRHAILTKLATLLGQAVPRRGIATDETFTLFLEALKKREIIPLIILDEVDQLLEKEEGSKLLYDLVRVTEHQKSRLGLILLSNTMELDALLDERVKSSLMQEKIVFNKYSVPQLKDILKERAEYAFQKNALHADVIPFIAAHAFKRNGDARVAIESLLLAGRQAEKANTAQVTVEHAKNAFQGMEENPAKKALPHVTETEKNILQMLAKVQPVTSGKLYEAYNKQFKASERTLRDAIRHLEQLKLITAELQENKGKTRILKLAIGKDAVEEL